ncbi:hypothetical protein K8354_16125 [Polaribacter litorisediminis]|uniref:hypothetical protein n=1 Tax=Polaribacter litorisediminis TaxID=1908341 RepID=UPI001CBB8116|nr:hypothetical protein [Polaribacter litorisediminis]UAM97797.1 hypothetical protein K8354_16125 [Polaribacter litorisediminis]
MKTILNLTKSVILVFSLVLISCEKDDILPTNLCEVQNPIEELAWLKEAIDEVRNDEYSYYSTALCQGERVFFYGNCDPTANYASFILNCAGDNLGITNELYDRLSKIEVIWKPENSKCTF